jgi:hypothetical protein
LLSYGFTFGVMAPSPISARPTSLAFRPKAARVPAGAQAIVLTNQNRAIPTPTGEQNGLIVSLDLSGLALK